MKILWTCGAVIGLVLVVAGAVAAAPGLLVVVAGLWLARPFTRMLRAHIVALGDAADKAVLAIQQQAQRMAEVGRQDYRDAIESRRRPKPPDPITGRTN